jgi:hypothetical protein
VVLSSDHLEGLLSPFQIFFIVAEQLKSPLVGVGDCSLAVYLKHNLRQIIGQLPDSFLALLESLLCLPPLADIFTGAEGSNNLPVTGLDDGVMPGNPANLPL